MVSSIFMVSEILTLLIDNIRDEIINSDVVSMIIDHLTDSDHDIQKLTLKVIRVFLRYGKTCGYPIYSLTYYIDDIRTHIMRSSITKRILSLLKSSNCLFQSFGLCQDW